MALQSRLCVGTVAVHAWFTHRTTGAAFNRPACVPGCAACRPVRPDAAVLVAARHDGYVDMASVKALQVGDSSAAATWCSAAAHQRTCMSA
jgi:hypothetical protein